MAQVQRTPITQQGRVSLQQRRERSLAETGAAASAARAACFAARRVAPLPAPSAFHSLEHLRALVGSICSAAPTPPALRAFIDIFDPYTIPLSDHERTGIVQSYPVIPYTLAVLAAAGTTKYADMPALAAAALESMAKTPACAEALWAARAPQALLTALELAQHEEWHVRLLPPLGELVHQGLPAPAAYDILPHFISLASSSCSLSGQEALTWLGYAAAKLAQHPSARQLAAYAELLNVAAFMLRTPPWAATPDAVYAATMLLVDLVSMECAATAAMLVRDGVFALAAYLVQRSPDLEGEVLCMVSMLLRHQDVDIVADFLDRPALTTYVFATVLHPDRALEDSRLALQCVYACFPQVTWAAAAAARVATQLANLGGVEVLAQACRRMPLPPAEHQAYASAARHLLTLLPSSEQAAFASLLADV